MPEVTRPGDIPADTNPVCGKCSMPAEYNDIAGGWQHAEAADAVFCGLVFGGTLA